MKVGVAVLAFIRRIGELEIGMAVAACDRRVASPQGKPRPRMVKFDLALDHLPIRGGVAGGARQIQLPVWTLSRGSRRPGRLPTHGARAQQNQHR